MSSSHTLKQVASRIFPGIYETMRWRFGLPGRYKRIMAVVHQYTQGRVTAGPFAGMVCAEATSGNHIPKLLGCYEQELHTTVETCIQRGYGAIINVGSGEGYYAVGFALRMPHAHIYAYDTDPQAQAECTNQAMLNGVADRVEVAGMCDPELLARLPLRGTLLVSDCEGYEGELLDPTRAPELAYCDMLVELHDHFVAGVTPLIRGRFAGTHAITLIDTTDRDPNAYAVLSALSVEDRRLAVSEGRVAPMQWAYLTALRG